MSKAGSQPWMVSVDALQDLDPRAWSALLAQESNMGGISVTKVTAERFGGGNLTRYTLTLSGYQEEVSLVGKRTNATEVRFYRHLSAAVSDLLPRCWFSHVSGSLGWVLLEESYNDRPRQSWAADDVEAVLQSLIRLHATFWEQDRYLLQSGMESILGRPHSNGAQADANGEGRMALQPVDGPFRTGWWISPKIGLSDHARRSAGALADTLAAAAEGLRLLTAFGGWPGVIEDEHLQAAEDLIDDPLPALYPLRQLPHTLLHGNPATVNWQLSILNEYRLLDWQSTTIGPGVLDLVAFIEQFELLGGAGDQAYCCAQWPTSQETMEDSYILGMGTKVGHRFNARANRLAIPAARCLFVLTTWFPRFAHWFEQTPPERDNWQALARLSDQDLATSGFIEMVEVRRHLLGVFERFLVAYRAL